MRVVISWKIYWLLSVSISCSFLTIARDRTVSYHIVISLSVSQYVWSARIYQCTGTTMGLGDINIHQWSGLTHWGRVTHICVGNLTIIGPDNGLSPGRRQAIIWTNAGILLIGPWETNYSEILIGIQTFSFKKMHLKMSSAKWRPFCLGLNVLILVQVMT